MKRQSLFSRKNNKKYHQFVSYWISPETMPWFGVLCPFQSYLTLVLLNLDVFCLCKQCRSQLIWICTVCYSIGAFIATTWLNLLAENWKWAWHLNLFRMTRVKIYWDDGRMIMKGSVQWSALQLWAAFCLQQDLNRGTPWSNQEG